MGAVGVTGTTTQAILAAEHGLLERRSSIRYDRRLAQEFPEMTSATRIVQDFSSLRCCWFR